MSAVDIPWTRYIPHAPTPKQHAFLWLRCREAFFGGAAGGGKSDALLMAALQYANISGYAAIIFRKTYTDLELPGAIMDRAQAWLMGTDAKWNNNDKEFTFPSGAKLTFAYLAKPKDKYRYQGAEFQFIAFDELTQFEEDDYTYLASRLRRPSDPDNPLSHVPLRLRGASNPGGVGHLWVKERFIDGRNPDRVFIPSMLEDNPHLDQEGYEESLALLSPVERAQLRFGDWTVRPPGNYVFDGQHIEACFELGRRYRVERPEPMDNQVHGCIDFGDFSTVFHPTFEIERGGLWLPGQEVHTSRADLEDITEQCMAVMKPHKYWWKELRYDSAFAQSARTFASLAQKELGPHNALQRRGRPSLYKVDFKTYKMLSVKYLRILMKNAFDEKTTRVLAIDPEGSPLLARQLPYLMEDELDRIEKDEDDAPDALFAGAAPLARKHRKLIQELEAKAKAKNEARVQPPGVDPDKRLRQDQAA